MALGCRYSTGTALGPTRSARVSTEKHHWAHLAETHQTVHQETHRPALGKTIELDEQHGDRTTLLGPALAWRQAALGTTTGDEPAQPWGKD
jgi:hypothetical protein